MFGNSQVVILHVHLNAQTGVNNVINTLIRRQSSMDGVHSSQIILYSRSNFLVKDFTTEDLVFKVPHLFGTGMYILLQFRNPLRRFVREFAKAHPSKRLVLHFHSAWLTGAYLPLLRSKNILYVSTIHGVADEHKLEKSFFRRAIHSYWAQRLTSKDSVKLTTVSSLAIPTFKRLFGCDISNAELVYNGIDLNKTHSAKPNGFNFAFIGQITEGKGWRIAVESFRKFQHQAINNGKLFICGDGPDSDELNREVAEDPSIVFLGLVEDARRKLLPNVDCLLVPSWSEGMPMVVLEAMAEGVPVISTKVGDLDSLFLDWYSIIFSERSVSAFAEKMTLLRQMKNRDIMVANSKVALSKFDIDNIIKHYCDIYEL